MRLSSVRLGVLLVSASLAVPAVAGAQPAQVPRGPQADQLRSQIAVMETVLERAVDEGIVATRSKLPDFFTGPLLLDGTNQARGFKIDGYGVFFVVEVPRLPPSMMWSMRVMARDGDAMIIRDLRNMRATLTKVSDEKLRGDLEQQIERLEMRVTGTTPSTRRLVGVETHTPEREPAAPLPDADAIYTEEVINALVRAVLQQTAMFEIGPDERVTIAARQSNSGPQIATLGEPQYATMYFTMVGRDLLALRSGQITREEARKRMVISNF